MKFSRRRVLQALPGVMPISAISLAGVSRAQETDHSEKLGLLLIGHGSPSPQWNQSFLEFGDRVAKPVVEEKGFTAVRTVLMEFASPSIADGLRELQDAGCEAVVAVPVFVTVGHHTLFDVPAALGIYYSRHSVEHLAEGGTGIAAPRVPILYTAALDEGDLLELYVLSEIRKLSQDPKNEALVLLIHGDAEQKPLLERRLRNLMLWCCAQSGITFADYAYIGVGQGFEHHGLPVLIEASEKRSRVLVIGLYVSLSAESILRRSAANSPRIHERLKDRDIAFSQGTLLDFPETVTHVLEIATQAANARASAHDPSHRH